MEACPPTLGYRLKKAYRRNKATLTTAAVVASALVAGTAVSAWQAVAARRAEASAVMERDERELARRAEQAQRELADRNAALADHERGNAVAARESLRRTHYAAQINLAQAALADGDVPRTDALLNEIKPGPSETDLRGFEWHYLRNRYRDEESSVAIPGTVGLSPKLSDDGTRVIYLLRPDPKSDRARIATYDLASGKQVGLFTSSFKTLSPGEISFQSVISSVNRDGSRVVLANVAESVATVHDTTTGREIHRRKLPNMSERRTQLWLSSDGRHLLATETAAPRPGAGPPACESTSLFDLDTGREAKAWDETAGRVCLSGDGTRLAYCRNEREIVIESVKTGMVEKTIAVPGLTRTGVRSLSADGKRLLLSSAVGAGGPTIGLPERTFDIQLLDVETGRASSPVRLPGPPTQISADGRWVAVHRGDATGTFRYDVIDAATGVTVREVRCPFRLGSVAFSPEGSRLVVGCGDGTIRTWSLSATQSGDGATTAEWCIARSANQTRFLLSVPNHEKSATQFRVVDDRGRTVATKVFATHLTQGSIDSYPRLDPSGQRVAYTTVTATADAPARFTKQIRVWDIERDTDRSVGDAWTSDRSVEPRLSFHPAGTHLAALVLRLRDATTETVLQIHDLKSGKAAESEPISGVLDFGLQGLGSFTELYDPAGTLPLKFRSEGKLTAYRFDGVTAAPLPFAEPGPFESRWAKSADGRYTVEEVIDRERLAQGQRDFLEQKHRDGEAVRLPSSSVVVRDAKTSATLLSAQEPERDIRSVILSPAGGLLLVCFEARPTLNPRVFGVERLYRVYRLSDGHTLYEFQTLSPMTNVEFSPDGRRLMTFQTQSPMATSRVGSGVRLRDAETGRELLTLQLPPAHRTVAFSPDGTRLYSLRGGGGPRAVGPAIHFWDGTPIPEPKKP